MPLVASLGTGLSNYNGGDGDNTLHGGISTGAIARDWAGEGIYANDNASQRANEAA